MRTNIFWGRVSAASGIVAALLLMAGIIVSDVNGEVSVTAPSSRIAETFIDNQSSILAGTYLYGSGRLLLDHIPWLLARIFANCHR